MRETIRFTLNGRPVTLDTAADRTLLWVLRTDLDLTGTKYGCGEGVCGSCTVIVDGRIVRSCQATLGFVSGKDVTTIEGLAPDGKLHPVQEAFVEHGGYQCGYCTPGMIMSVYGLLLENPRASRDEILEGMEPNLCRCGAHTRIVRAIETAAAQMGGRND
ncbi:MAG: (2Fe-2S)-binding protein [Gemmatimonadota bacterium]|nr:(2Fe-2S)-binding protein [Gemmatimonadota bacterium]MDH3367227.1 (2Fe-2S)-binding protein [Gemmatimonadota bacterium]MDH3478134.1 (2Fe-2S)-binding protein [Gemmatimonadota bacterium]MDH3569962.1 (2Fe-2S)-binding protein [Gemmatimonadota bacterium]MDH5550121.1 (2Fe-2S)-binding protein [Gemmatimonadota bacterium]